MDVREKLIIRYIKGKALLDMGPGDTTYRFLHDFLKKNAKSVLGVELDRKRAIALTKKGYNIVQGNAETINLKKRFDVVIAGDLIEHLDNPGHFLDNASLHLKDDGVFIFNTPNIYAINYLLRGYFFLGNVKHFDEHTLGFTEQLLKELLRRHGLEAKEVIYFTHKEPGIKSLIMNILSGLVPKWRENILVIARKKR
jgi:2-polyprenyl-3-methyl-5-hydroxy-6-metoxy-1,4-benzoquinol methylase